MDHENKFPTKIDYFTEFIVSRIERLKDTEVLHDHLRALINLRTN